jgi:hypothetical protein
MVAADLWLARQESRRESQPGLRAFYRRRVTPIAVNLRLARVLHRRRVNLIALNLRLAEAFTVDEPIR